MSDTTSYNPLPFKSAVDFLQVFHPSLRNKSKTLNAWQIWALDFLSDRESLEQGKRPRYTIAERLKLILCAANGSGKDAFIIAGFVCFVLCCWKRYKIVITSSSGLQLDTQTRTYIRDICQEVNAYLRSNGVLDEDAIDIREKDFTSSLFEKPDGSKFGLTGSQIITFVTDEGGRAEGHHPWPDAMDGEGLIIIINEGKSVPDEIYNHLGKCTYNIWIEVSSAGEASLHFYNALASARDWTEGWTPNTYIKRVITSYDCPHKDPRVIEADKLEHGENSDFFLNTHMSAFTNTGTSVVITDKTLKKCLASAKNKIDIGQPIRAGLDLSAGGDECVLAVYDNNVCIGMETWRSKDTEATIDLLCGDAAAGESGFFHKYGLRPENIYADEGGLGQPILCSMARRLINANSNETWVVVRVSNQSAAFNKSKYLNRGIELWVRFARLIETCIVVLPNDPILHKQLINRHHEMSGCQGKKKLLSKDEEKLLGNTSPDRADATVLAFTGLTITDFYEGKVTKAPPSAGLPTIETVVAGMATNKTASGLAVPPPIDYSQVYAQLRREFKDNEPVANDNKFSNPINVMQSLY